MNKPSNTREQCAFDRGAQSAQKAQQEIDTSEMLDLEWVKIREQRNPHKKSCTEYNFWNEGFNSV